MPLRQMAEQVRGSDNLLAETEAEPSDAMVAATVSDREAASTADIAATTFVPKLVTEEMVGHRLGEFSPTKKFLRHGGKMQKRKTPARRWLPAKKRSREAPLS